MEKEVREQIDELRKRISKCKLAIEMAQSEIEECEKTITLLSARAVVDEVKKDLIPDLTLYPWNETGTGTPFPQQPVVTVYSCPNMYPVNSPNIFTDMSLTSTINPISSEEVET